MSLWARLYLLLAASLTVCFSSGLPALASPPSPSGDPAREAFLNIVRSTPVSQSDRATSLSWYFLNKPGCASFYNEFQENRILAKVHPELAHALAKPPAPFVVELYMRIHPYDFSAHAVHPAVDAEQIEFDETVNYCNDGYMGRLKLGGYKATIHRLAYGFPSSVLPSAIPLSPDRAERLIGDKTALNLYVTGTTGDCDYEESNDRYRCDMRVSRVRIYSGEYPLYDSAKR